jgi:hypothetical protein
MDFHILGPLEALDGAQPVTLPVLKGEAGERFGLCAMGPVADGDELTFLRVWLWQQDGKKLAVCFDTSGKHPGAHPLAPTERLPFKGKKGWMIQTQLEPGSKQFSIACRRIPARLALRDQRGERCQHAVARPLGRALRADLGTRVGDDVAHRHGGELLEAVR